MQSTAICPVSRVTVPKQNQKNQSQSYRIKRQFSTQRRLHELVRDLLRAHSGE